MKHHIWLFGKEKDLFGYIQVGMKGVGGGRMKVGVGSREQCPE